MAQTRKFEDKLRSLGVCLALPYTIMAVTYLTSENLQIDYASPGLTKRLPLEFYRTLSPFLIMGTFANNFSNLGSSFDSIIDGVNTFPYNDSWEDFKNWTMGVESKNAGHVIGTLFGAGVGAYFIYCNATDPNAIFLLSFGQANSIPNWLFQIGAIPYIAGAFSNSFSHLSEGATDFIKASFTYINPVKEKIFNCYATFFRKSSQIQSNNQPTLEHEITEQVEGNYFPLRESP